MKRNDWILIFVLCGVSLVLFLAVSLFQSKGTYVRILTDGIETARYPLSVDGEFLLTGYDGGKNVLVISDGTAYFSEADCPDLLCVKMGKIRKSGETIVCLPHRIVAEIGNDKEDAAVDAVSR